MKPAQEKARARRQRIPAFGEWNYAYVHGAGAGDWPVTQYFDSAMHGAGPLVMAIPPKHTKVVKWRESSGTAPTLELDDEDEKQHVVVGLGHGDLGGAVKKQGKQQSQSPVVVAHAYKACHRVGPAAVVVKAAMDQDLYHIPPDMLCHEPRKRLTRRSLWMGCLGLNCVA